MIEKLRQLKKSFNTTLKEVDNDAKLADFKARFLGKKGELGIILKSLNTKSPQERKVLGQAANKLNTA